jgi:hypothetical protein
MLLIFSEPFESASLSNERAEGPIPTDIKDIATTAGVQMQWCVTCWAMLRIHLADELVEACLMRHMGARELQYPLASQCMLQRFLANSTFAPNKGALSA